MSKDMAQSGQVGIYIRLSVEDDEKYSIENQKRVIFQYLKDMPQLQVYNVYCDNGKTGTDFDRPAFLKLMEDVRLKAVDCIIVKDLSRFGRNYIETGNFLERLLPQWGVRFISVTDGYDSQCQTTEKDGFMIPIKNLINDFYARDISKKVGTTIQMKQSLGVFVGARPPYGYKRSENNKGCLEIDYQAAQTVKKIFQWKLEGFQYAEIADKLAEQDIAPPNFYLGRAGAKKQWSVRTIKRILSNPMYQGDMVQGKVHQSLYEGIEAIDVEQENWKIVKNTHEAIIDRDVFLKAAVHLKTRCNKKILLDPFKDKVYCSVCGSSIAGKRKKSNNGNDFFYRCQSAQVCNTEVVSQYDIQHAIENAMKQMQDANTSMIKQQKQIEQDIIRLNRRKKNIYESVCMKRLSISEYYIMKQYYDNELEILLQRKNEAMNAADTKKEGLFADCMKPPYNWIDTIILKADGVIEVEFRYDIRCRQLPLTQ